MEFNGFPGEEYLYQGQLHEHYKPNEVSCCTCDKLMEMIQDFKSSLKSLVKEEVEEAFKRVILPHFFPEQTRSMPHQAEPSASKMLYLRIDDHCIPESLFTMNKIQHQVDSLVVELVDEFGNRVEDNPESSAKIRMVVLNGDFEVEDNNWTNDDFKKNIVLPRKDKASSLLKGECKISLVRGVASVGHLCFTDNSKRIGTFKLGAEVMTCPPGVNIKAAISKAFKVKERRLLYDRKHENPSPEDGLWRLKHIRRDGAVYERAKKASINTVKDFLQLLHTDPKRLYKILNVGETNWKDTVENAEACVLSNDICRYNDDTNGVELLLDCAFNIVSITFRGQNSQCYESLNDHQKQIVNKVRSDAYEIRSQLETYTPTNQMQGQAEQSCLYNIPPSINVQCHEAAFLQGQPQISGVSNMYMQQTGGTSVQQGSYEYVNPSYQFNHKNQHSQISEGQVQDNPEWLDQLLNGEWELPEIPTEQNVTSKLRAACYVTKAATMFMIAIKQDHVPLKKKRKFQ